MDQFFYISNLNIIQLYTCKRLKKESLYLLRKMPFYISEFFKPKSNTRTYHSGATTRQVIDILLLLFTCNVVNRKGGAKFNKTFSLINMIYRLLNYFKIVNSRSYSDSSDDLNSVYAAEYIEDDVDKTESQQTHQGNSTAHV